MALRDLGVLPADLWAAWREGGRHALWAELREGVIFQLFRHGRVVVIEQDLGALPDVPMARGVEIAAFRGDWSRLADIANARTRARFRRAALRGRTCFVAWRSGRPIGSTWLSTRVDPDLEMYPLVLPRGTVYGWNLYVVPSERNRGVGSSLAAARLRHARERGFDRAWRVIDIMNRASVRTVEKTAGTGTRPVGEVRYVKLLNRVMGRFEPYETPRSVNEPATTAR